MLHSGCFEGGVSRICQWISVKDRRESEDSPVLRAAGGVGLPCVEVGQLWGMGVIGA